MPTTQNPTSVQFGGGSIFGSSPITSIGVKDTGENNTSASSVREYAYEEDRNLRFRPQMEDSKNCSIVLKI